MTVERRSKSVAFLLATLGVSAFVACGGANAASDGGDDHPSVPDDGDGADRDANGAQETSPKPSGKDGGALHDADVTDAVTQEDAGDGATTIADGGNTGDATAIADGGNTSDATATADAASDASPTHDAQADSAPEGGDAGATFQDETCDPLVLETSVPATGALAAQETRAVVFLANGTQWTLVSGGAGSTQAASHPAGIATAVVQRTEVSPDGRILVQFTAAGAPYAAFLDGGGAGAWSGAVELPAGTVEVHADANGHLYALDGGQVLWAQGASAAFDNLGALPIPAYSTNFAFTVDAASTIHLARVTSSAKIHLEMLRRPPGGAWSAPIDVHVEDFGFPLMEPRLAAGRDGSVHLAWWRGNPHGSPRDELYARSMGGASWTVPERLASGAALLDFEARGYDSAQALLQTQDYIAGYGNQWARRCAPPNAYGWPSTKLTTDPASAARGVLRASPSGRPTFMLSEKSVGRVVVRAK